MTPAYSEIHQTPTGVVFLLGERAYKVKKPVAFAFCDFGTVAARTAACHREVELNRRLTTDVYLGVGELPTAEGTGGEPAVLMARMPAERTLSTRVSSGAVGDEDVRAIARLVATFHEQCRGGPDVAAEGSRDALRARWNANLDVARVFGGAGLDAADVEAVAADAEQFLAGREPLLRRRIDEHRIVDGHGDLLAEDIFCLDDGPRILDCLDYDDRLRYVDGIDDIASLAVDLEHLGSPELTGRLLGWYREFSGDTAPPALVHHYIAYRAFVRAKLACLREDQGDAAARESARNLMSITRRHLGASAVRLVLVGGLPGTGKSTLAGLIGDELGHVVLSSDRIRKELAGLDPLGSVPAAHRPSLHTPEHTRAVYTEMLARAELLLGLGESVTLDASWCSGADRAAATELAVRTHSRLTSLRCQARSELASRRVRLRGGPTDADDAVAATMRADGDLWPPSLIIDTAGAPAEAAAIAVDLIHPAAQGRPWFASAAFSAPQTGGHQVFPPGWTDDGMPLPPLLRGSS
jgi:aminoglycoside phosphotransferase family enzyme/predicted kinase